MKISSPTWELCDPNFLKMKSVDDPDKLRKIEKESKTHHARSDGAYKALENDGEKGEVTKIQFVLIWNRCFIALR